jgi:SAM-dependent methyltransferase
MRSVTSVGPLTQQDDWSPLYGDDSEPASLKLRQSYERLFWEQQLPGFLKHVRREGRLIELGSAPGRYAMLLSRITGCEPFGVEYTQSGVALNRRTFSHYSIDPDNVFHASFLDEQFQAQHDGAFDVVASFGLIEHFEDPTGAISAHLALLKPDGTAVISIPNYRGWNGFWINTMNPSIRKGHNFEIMKLRAFKSLFARPDLDIVYCGMAARYHYFFTGPQKGWRRLVQLLLINTEDMVHKLMKAVAPVFSMESRFFSPYILCVARKKA